MIMESRIRVVYIVSNIEKALAFEWINDHLDRAKFDLAFILIGQPDTQLEQHLKRNNPAVFHVAYKNKSDFFSALVKVLKYLNGAKPEIVHTHLFEANRIGLTAAWLLGVSKRIFTRHHAMVHYDEFPRGRRWDRWCNYIATDIVAPTETIKEILIDKDKAEARKIHLISHGFDLNYFTNVSKEDVERLKNKYAIPPNAYPVVGVIARYVEWKGVQYVIPAFAQIRKKWPHAHLVLANADGDFRHEIRQILNTLEQRSFTEIKFENDLASLYRIFHVHVHTPVDKLSEAFGQTYVEALASGVPSVFTASGIANEFIKHRQNALLVDYKSSSGIYHAISGILEDEILMRTLIANGLSSVKSKFNLASMMQKLSQLYDPTFKRKSDSITI
jgi:glycosyltransferase involved in cell wall biosynthesis